MGIFIAFKLGWACMHRSQHIGLILYEHSLGASRVGVLMSTARWYLAIMPYS